MLKFIFALMLSLIFSFTAFSQYESDILENDDKGWTVWASLGGQINSDPAACTAGNLTFVFARGTDYQIWYRKRYLPTGVWGPWKRTPLIPQAGVQVSGSPAALCFHNPRSDTFLISVVGTNNRLWSIAGNANATTESFGAWTMHPGFNAATYSGPALAGWPASRTITFVRGGDNRLYVKIVPSVPTPLPPQFQLLIPEPSYNDPTAIMPSIDRVDFFYRDQFGNLWQQFMIGTLWYPPQFIPGVTYSSPEVVSRDIYSLDLFAKGPNSTLIHKRSINGVWGPWVNLGGYITGSPGAATYASNVRIMVFVRWADGSLRYKAWAP